MARKPASTFGNVHGFYKPGNGKDKPFDLVLHSGSGSTVQEIAEAAKHLGSVGKTF
ncbi:hypothetical protein GCM10023063_42490 [Arthrobacter methylotrophus]